MPAYEITSCVARETSRPCDRNCAVFVRRIDPPLTNVYTIICDRHGRARPWMATNLEQSLIRTGPVMLQTDYIYLAAWIPAAELARQGDITVALSRMRQDARYAFQPSDQDQHRRRIMAARWQGDSPPLSPADQALVSVLTDMGLSDLATRAISAEPPVRRQIAALLIELLDDVRDRELGEPFILGASDATGQFRDRLLTNARYRDATPDGRARMIADWQRRLAAEPR